MKKAFKITTRLLFSGVAVSLLFSSCKKVCVCEEKEIINGNTYKHTEVYELERGDKCSDYETDINIICRTESRTSTAWAD